MQSKGQRVKNRTLAATLLKADRERTANVHPENALVLQMVRALHLGTTNDQLLAQSATEDIAEWAVKVQGNTLSDLIMRRDNLQAFNYRTSDQVFS